MPSGKKTVWMVDDDRADHEMFRRVLEETGVEFKSFYSAESALAALLEGGRPSLILLDVRMPGLGGFHLLDQRRTLAHPLAIPVIVLSSSSDPRDVARAYELGANVYVQKPDDYVGLRKFGEVLTKFWFELAHLPPAAKNGFVH